MPVFSKMQGTSSSCRGVVAAAACAGAGTLALTTSRFTFVAPVQNPNGHLHSSTAVMLGKSRISMESNLETGSTAQAVAIGATSLVVAAVAGARKTRRAGDRRIVSRLADTSRSASNLPRSPIGRPAARPVGQAAARPVGVLQTRGEALASSLSGLMASAGDDLVSRVQTIVQEASESELPATVARSVAAQVLSVLAATAVPCVAMADSGSIDFSAIFGETPPGTEQQQVVQVQLGAPSVDEVSGRVSYSKLLDLIGQDAVKRIDFYEQGSLAVAQVQGDDGGMKQLACDLPGTMRGGLVEKLHQKHVVIDVHNPAEPDKMMDALMDVASPLLFVCALLLIKSRQGGAPGMPGGMQGKAQLQMQPDTGVKFEDVAGIDEAKQELEEIVDFLKTPQRFINVGASIPKGVLLTGPPGTGKTLMAKALAGESGVPFIQASAAEFIEMFVGVGAARVRDMFKQAKENAPCIVFIDEIDAIGRQRGSGMGGGNDEREQTLNQILTEMDGFEGATGVIVVAATNRADVLDNALLRPGRFDRRVEVGLPDIAGRQQILQVHCKNKPLAEDVQMLEVAQRTVGFSGADLENLMNESAILAARRHKKAITLNEINDATDRVVAGLQGRLLPDNAAKKLIAYHEAGHALVGTLLPFSDPVNKVTLVPRGNAKGLTWFTPGEDQSLVSTNMFRARIATALGGRAAEQVVFGQSQVTTGAGGDLQQVESMARAMVTQFGMSDVGSMVFSGGDFTGPSYSEEVAGKIDDAIREISDQAHLTALRLIMEHRICLDRIAAELVESETMTGDRLREIVAAHAQIPDKSRAV